MVEFEHVNGNWAFVTASKVEAVIGRGEDSSIIIMDSGEEIPVAGRAADVVEAIEEARKFKTTNPIPRVKK